MGEPKIESQPANPLFDKKLINTFIDSVIRTLGDMAQTKVAPGKPTIGPSGAMKGEIAGIIGMVSGNTKGNLILTFSEHSAYQILHNMLGETYNTICPEVTDAVGELTNMIYGSAKTTLNNLGFKFEMAIPTVVTGNFQLAAQHSGITLTVPFEVAPGKNIYVEVSVQT